MMDKEQQEAKLNIIARILKMRVRDGRKNYLVDWRGTSRECEWIEPDRSDEELKQLIEEFHREAAQGQSYSSSMLDYQTLSQLNQSEQSSMEDENSRMEEEESLEMYNRIAEEENFFAWASRFLRRLQARIAGIEVRKNKSQREVDRFVSFFKRGNLICLIAFFAREEKYMMVSVKEAKKYFSKQLSEFFRRFAAYLSQKQEEEPEMSDCKSKVEYLAEMLGFWWKASRPEEDSEERRREVVPREKYEPSFEELKEFLQFTVREPEPEKNQESHIL